MNKSDKRCSQAPKQPQKKPPWQPRQPRLPQWPQQNNNEKETHLCSPELVGMLESFFQKWHLPIGHCKRFIKLPFPFFSSSTLRRKRRAFFSGATPRPQKLAWIIITETFMIFRWVYRNSISGLPVGLPIGKPVGLNAVIKIANSIEK